MTATLPPLFVDRLKHIIPSEHIAGVLKSFESKKQAALRINTLKTTRSAIENQLKENGIVYSHVPWADYAFCIDVSYLSNPFIQQALQEGRLYQQNLSSQLVTAILDPQPGERILDVCAAPGSKTSQLAMLMHNEGQIVAIEKVRSRFYRLRRVLELLGVQNTQVVLTDARRYQAQGELFDKILVDAPCSSEGRFSLIDPDSFRYWSPRKIREMQTKQKGLIKKAVDLLKNGGTLVYSTCTFAPEENEGVLNWLLKKYEGRLSVEKIDVKGIKTYPGILSWNKKEYDQQLRFCTRILPDNVMDGFFITKIRKA